MLTVLPIGSALDPVPTFRLVDSGATGSELNLGLDSAGNIFVGGWNAVARSTDDGATWTLHGTIPAITFAADRVLVVDKDTGRVFVDDTTLGCTILSWSDDQAQTWTTNPLACGGGATDHQKIAVGRPVTLPATPLYPNLVYVCANGLSHTDCGVSNDGGLTFLTTAPHGVGCAFQGAPISDAAGNLFEPTSQCGLKVRRNIQNGLAQWQEFTVTTASSTDAPDLTATPDGTLYLVHTGLDWKPQLWRSTSHGLSWTGPYAIPVPGLVSAAFPVVVAGANGRIAISFYGSTTDALGWDHNPGTAPATTRWEGYVAVV
ncbi:MAG TPA: sialidase family protein, partial [Candidatus Thermoplasmatota archaeon]|nr:sialidase family protein [Candidatus Thermoplasmatota archaeon]